MQVLKAILVTCLLASCSDGEFSGAADKIAAKKAKPCDPKTDSLCGKPQTPNIPTPPTQNLEVDNGGRTNTTLCTKGDTPIDYSLSVRAHRDSARNNSTNLPQSDVAMSEVKKFDFAQLEGNILPVSQFGLDDVVFIVKESDNFPAIGRNINLPAHAIMIYNAADPNFASGAVDSTAPTTYTFPGKPAVNVPPGKYTLRYVYGLGAPLIAHNQIKLQDLKDKGFVDAAGKVAFKLMHVAHGIGSVGMTIIVKPCK